jgi:hypothetical protein
MSKKKKKNQARPEASPSASADETKKVSADEEEAGEDTKEAGSEAAEASHEHEHEGDGHAADAHGHDVHDPVEDDHPNNALITVVTIISCLSVVGMVIGVRELFVWWGEAELKEKVLAHQSSELRALRTSEQQKLTHYQWASQKDGVVRIPVDRAVELTVASYRNPPPVPPPAPELAPKPEEKKGEDVKDDKGAEKKDDKGGDKKDEKKDNKREDKPKERNQ